MTPIWVSENGNSLAIKRLRRSELAKSARIVSKRVPSGEERFNQLRRESEPVAAFRPREVRKRLQVSNPKRPGLEVRSLAELINFLPENNVRLLQNVMGFRTIRVKRKDIRQHRSLMLADLPNRVRR